MYKLYASLSSKLLNYCCFELHLLIMTLTSNIAALSYNMTKAKLPIHAIEMSEHSVSMVWTLSVHLLRTLI